MPYVTYSYILGNRRQMPLKGVDLNFYSLFLMNIFLVNNYINKNRINKEIKIQSIHFKSIFIYIKYTYFDMHTYISYVCVTHMQQSFFFKSSCNGFFFFLFFLFLISFSLLEDIMKLLEWIVLLG